MDWSKFVAALITRGGIEEIILSGCKIPDVKLFAEFMESAVPLQTVRLGLAHNGLTQRHLELLADWLGRPENLKVIRGLDLGYNDLSATLPLLTAAARKQVLSQFKDSQLSLISLNSTNLSNLKDTEELVTVGSQLPDLKYFDLSGNKKLFPGLIDHLTYNLPLFPNLARLNLDYNDLDPTSIIRLAEVLPLCLKLNYVSLVGNKLTGPCVAALTAALKASSSIIMLDIDYDQIPVQLKEKIGLLTMKNTEKLMRARVSDANSPFETAARSLTAQIIDFFKDFNSDEEFALSHHDITVFLTQCRAVRRNLHDLMTALFKLQLKDALSTEGKETLIRLCFFDSSIERALNLLKHRLVKSDGTKAELLMDYSTKLDLNGQTEPGNDDSDGSLDESNLNGIAPVIDNSNARYVYELRTEDNNKLSHFKHTDEPVQEIPRTSVSTRVNTLADEGEGKALKISTMFPHTHMDMNFCDVSGDVIRARLEDTESTEVIAYLKTLKESGISLESLFQKVCPNEKETLTVEKLRNVAATMGSEKLEERRSSVSSVSDDDALNDAYDELLNGLVKVKTGTAGTE
ncbi:hypothetical protein BABINDRAFT_163725 [Babjeviella inositovora NRRL Y-12698]|uniref:Uncharacterized protein n=1 Tax=Babjeviella inositovora NRRL Y-12698 TaxID=984486 RepID=A0A1E3QIG1_9ASCO|nr:uncharacterized protein BABINDRAFT_163725 [Babjeviella inositovora NRRL Y-12698]ODQ77224.1 hypothetical protein BABINDRAFT_163725 [Babjeviella inositovora NRRL Y-12698]